MDRSEPWDVLIVGAGAAGLLAAARAAERGRSTLLLEKNARAGVKILMSGGTRCNLTQATDRRGIVAAFPRRQGSFLQSALAALSPQDLVQLIEQEGVATKVESTGKIFPVSNRASDVLDALLRRLQRSGAELALQEGVLQCRVSGTGGFDITTVHRQLHGRQLVITSGGQSYPGSGTTGDGYAWARSFGHHVTPLCPALTPVVAAESWLAALRGVTLPDVQVDVLSADVAVATAAGGKLKPRDRLATRRGSVLFAHFGLSGPAILDVSRAVSGSADPRRLVLRCDFLPDESDESLQQHLQRLARESGRSSVAGELAGWLPRRVIDALLLRGGLQPQQRLAELSKVQAAALVRQLKRQDIRIETTRGYQKAEVTAGGVALDEIDSSTMQSKLVPGLFFAGEILDVDGPIGGYNFQAAFSTGWLAGSHL